MLPLGMAAVLAIGVAGCSSTSHTAGPSSTASVSSGLDDSAGPAASGSAIPGPTASVILADGRSPVYLTSIDVAHHTLTFDLIQFLTGDAAKAAWKKANPGSTQDGPDNDYFIVNDNPKLRTLPVVTPVDVEVVDMNSTGGVANKPIAFADLQAYLAANEPGGPKGQLGWHPFWLTVTGGQIVKIEEQFLP
jgi:hypothetical protein